MYAFNEKFWWLVFINQVPYIVLFAIRDFWSSCAFMSRLILISNFILALNSSFHLFSFFSMPSNLFIWAVPSKLSWHWHRFHPNHITPLPCERLTKCSSRRENIHLITTNLWKPSSQKTFSLVLQLKDEKNRKTSWLCSTFSSLLSFSKAVYGPCYWAASLDYHLRGILITDFTNLQVP